MVVSISFCSEKENFLSGSLDRTVLLWDQRAEKSQVHDTVLWDKLKLRHHLLVPAWETVVLDEENYFCFLLLHVLC